MALQVWLPLTKDLSNQGLADVVITNNGATFNNIAGKLGGCYYFTPNQWIKISIPEHMTTIKNITVAAWVKSHSNTLALGGISHDSNASLAGISLYTNGWQLSGSGSSYKYIASGITANNQEWHHVACTIANDEITTYANGAKIFSTTLTAQGIISTDITSDHFIEIGCDHPGGNEYLTGYVNDFRIYDHCLSLKEIKELAKGLVLHYKLDKINGGNPNIIPNTSVEERQYTYPTSGFQDKFAVTTTVIPTATQYTLSFYAKSTVAGDKIRAHYYSPNTTTTCVSSQGITKAASDGNMDFTLSTSWEQYWVTYTQTETTAVKRVILPRMGAQNNNNGVISGTGTVSIKCVKLEAGDKPTLWLPNSTDSTYTSLGLDQNLEFDCSGYNNNGTIIGTLTNSTDTPKYSVSVNFTNNADTISPMACFSNGQTLTALTTSIWAKTNTMNSVAPNLISLGENSFWRFRIASATSVWYYIRVGTTQIANTLSVPSSITSTLLDNKWHLYTLVFDQGIAKFYIDSVLIGTGNHTGTATYLTCGSTAWHLAGYTSNAENFIGSLSDFHIYTTALSAEDIAELYHTAASVDNYGNIYTYEFEEV